MSNLLISLLCLSSTPEYKNICNTSTQALLSYDVPRQSIDYVEKKVKLKQLKALGPVYSLGLLITRKQLRFRYKNLNVNIKNDNYIVGYRFEF